MRRPARPAAHRAARGFTLVEVGVVIAVSATLATLAVPSWLDQLVRSRRAEATTELRRLHWAQERHLERHGRYAASLAELPGAGRSANGHYRLELVADGAQGYALVARAQGSQARDRACPELRLRVRGAISQREPEGACWSL